MKTADIATFAAHLTTAAGRPAGKEAAELIRLAATHQRLRVESCNRELTEREEKRLENTRKKITDISAACNCEVVSGKLPRPDLRSLWIDGPSHHLQTGKVEFRGVRPLTAWQSIKARIQGALS